MLSLFLKNIWQLCACFSLAIPDLNDKEFTIEIFFNKNLDKNPHHHNLLF